LLVDKSADEKEFLKNSSNKTLFITVKLKAYHCFGHLMLSGPKASQILLRRSVLSP